MGRLDELLGNLTEKNPSLHGSRWVVDGRLSSDIQKLEQKNENSHSALPQDFLRGPWKIADCYYLNFENICFNSGLEEL